MIRQLFSLVVKTALLFTAATSAAPAIAGDPPPPVKAGAIGTLELEGEQTVWMARSEPDYLAMQAAAATLYDKRPDRPGGGGAAMHRLAAAKRVRAYAVGTRVRVVKSAGGPLVVQVLAGEDKGARGWVDRAMFRAGK